MVHFICSKLNNQTVNTCFPNRFYFLYFCFRLLKIHHFSVYISKILIFIHILTKEKLYSVHAVI